MKVNILGTEYTIEKKAFKDEPIFEKKCVDGYCDGRLKKIVYCDMRTHPIMENDTDEYCKVCEKQTLRHEVIHGFFNESGLMESSAQFTGGWSQNEEMVDWISLQSPKIFKTFQELDILQESNHDRNSKENYGRFRRRLRG